MLLFGVTVITTIRTIHLIGACSILVSGVAPQLLLRTT